jgi:transcription antitermination protein NusB
VGARSKARKRALDILYECEMRGAAIADTLAERVSAAAPPVGGYAVQLVEGVAAHQQEIDALLTRYAKGWTLPRMPAVDRAILRIGAYEVQFNDDVPDEVAVAEAVALARDLSTDESPQFVNGLLAALARDRSPGSVSGESRP